MTLDNSRFQGLEAPAGDFHLLLSLSPDTQTYFKSLFEQGAWCVANSKQLQSQAWLALHARMAEAVWVDLLCWQKYGVQLRESQAAVIVVAAASDTLPSDPPPLLVDMTQPEKLLRLYLLLRQQPSLRFALRRHYGATADDLSQNWLIDGPVDSSYSLAIVNREMGRALKQLGIPLKWSDPELLQRSPEKKFLTPEEYHDLTSHPRPPAVHARNNYPPEVDDMGGLLNLYLNYAWEEMGFPPAWIDGFNQRLDGMTVVSSLVRDILRNHGLRIPVEVTGNGIDHIAPPAAAPQSAEKHPAFTFVHISSCFPRKGVDILLQAWGEAFTADDPVRLIVKTFHNPHNQAQAHLQRLQQRHPDHAPVELIMEDWPQDRLNALLHQADALVAPSRAEGFGMPFAEAMACGVPVIVTGWGGHRDFCTDETAWLIDYTFAPARSHVSTPESVWAEPDPRHLAVLMRQLVDMPDAQRQQKTEYARRYVVQRYRWKQLAQKTLDFVHGISSAPALFPEPRVLWISTFNSQCGIAEYSRNLLKAFPPGQYAVLADIHSTPLREDPPYVSRVLAWTQDDIDVIVEAAADYDIVLFQHHHAFYGLSTLAEMVSRLKAQGKQVMITFHNTHAPHTGAGFDQPAFRQADRILVHSVSDLNRLKQAGLVDNVALFPHGIYEHDSTPEQQAHHRRQLGLENARIIATFGFLMPHKGVAELVRAFARLAQQDPSLKLLLLNSFHPATPSEEEKKRLDQLIDTLGLQTRVVCIHEYLPEQTAIEWLSLADVTVFPYRNTQESASGAVRMAIAAGRPIVATPLPIFDDIAPLVRFTRDLSEDALVMALQETLQAIDQQGIEAMVQPVVAWRERYGWRVLSQRLWNLMVGLKHDAHVGSA